MLVRSVRSRNTPAFQYRLPPWYGSNHPFDTSDVRSPTFHTVPYSRNENGCPKLSRFGSGKYDADRSRVRKSTVCSSPGYPRFVCSRWRRSICKTLMSSRVSTRVSTKRRIAYCCGSNSGDVCSRRPFGPGTLSVWNGRMLRYAWSVASSFSRSSCGNRVYGSFDRWYR